MTNRIEIHAGKLRKVVTHSSGGTSTLSYLNGSGPIGYFVDLVENGNRLGIWDGESHAGAIQAANDWAADFNTQVIDLTGKAA